MLMNPSIAGAIAFFVFRTMISSRPDTAEDIKPEDLKDTSNWKTYVAPTRAETSPVILLMRESAELMFNSTIPEEDKLVLLGRMSKKMATEEHRDFYYAAVHVAARFERYLAVKEEFIRAFFKDEPAMGENLFNDLYLLYISTDFQDAEVPGKRTELMTQVIASHTGLW